MKCWHSDSGAWQMIFKTDKGSQSLQHKQRRVFVAKNRIQTFKQELESWETHFHHRELDSVLRLQGSCDEVGSDVNECDFSTMKCTDMDKTQ